MKMERCRVDARASETGKGPFKMRLAVAGLAAVALLSACSSPDNSIVPLEAGILHITSSGEAVIRGCFYQKQSGGNQSDPVILERLALRTDKTGHVGAAAVPALTYKDPAKNKQEKVPFSDLSAQGFVAPGVDTAQYGFECTKTIGKADAAELDRFDGAVVRVELGPDGTTEITGPFREGTVAASPNNCPSGFASPAPADAPPVVGACLASVTIRTAAKVA